MRPALLIAFYYPPMRGSSGVLRPLKFSQYLGRYGWQSIVLTANVHAYGQSDERMPALPSHVQVHRAFALDAARHLAIGGRYPKSLALPDRWVSWRFDGVRRAMALVRRLKPAVLWSTYPIATAHAIALEVHRRTGIPWVADCRDSMTEDEYPRDPRTREAFLAIESRMVRTAACITFTAPGTVRMYAERYPEVPAARWRLLPNGYDEEDFITIPRYSRSTDAAPLKLVHSGLLYPIERDPRALFVALAHLLGSGAVRTGELEIVLRATGHDTELGELIRAYGVGQVVRLEPGLPYRDALAEMATADGLLILQAANCNHQIPAKLYEYMRAGRPLLALTDPAGDTARQIEAIGAGVICPLDDAQAIQRELPKFLAAIRARGAPVAAPDAIRRFDRAEQTRELAAIFEAAAGSAP